MIYGDRWLSIVALLGWLALALAGYSSYRLNWKKSVTAALIWVAIFTGVAILIGLIRGSASIGEAIGLTVG